MHNRAMNTPIAWPSAEQVIDETRHWMLQAVIGLNLCPFAKAVHVKNQIRYVVSEATTPEELAHDLIEELQFLNQADPQEVDTTLLIHPQTLNDFLDYNDFLDVADAAVTKLDLEGILQVASFHPSSSSRTPSLTTSRTTPTARRTPRCTCCARTASKKRFRPSRRLQTSSRPTSRPWKSWATTAGSN